MYTSEQVIQKLNSIRNYLKSFRNYAVSYACQTAILKIRQRVTRGDDLRGRAFKAYSTRPIYIRSPYANLSKFYPGGYAQYKPLVNSNYLEMSGDMLMGIVFKPTTDGGQVAPATEDVKRKIVANENLDRLFFGLMDEESSDILNKIYQKAEGDINAILNS